MLIPKISSIIKRKSINILLSSTSVLIILFLFICFYKPSYDIEVRNITTGERAALKEMQQQHNQVVKNAFNDAKSMR